jgi:acyl carrier protein
MSMAVSTRDEVVQVVRGCLASELRIDTSELPDDATLRDLPGADSMHLLRIVASLERHWNIEFDDEEVFGARTVDELVGIILSHLPAAN